jgi:transposase
VDTGTTRTFLQAPAPRVRCPEQGCWSRMCRGRGRARNACTCWRTPERGWVKNMALSAVAVFLRLSWRTVSGIVTRVVAELTGNTDQLDGLRRIGIDEIAYRVRGTGI